MCPPPPLSRDLARAFAHAAAQILTLYKGAIFGEMSFLNGDVASATVVAELPCGARASATKHTVHSASCHGRRRACVLA
jgi:hypothetical protein